MNVCRLMSLYKVLWYVLLASHLFEIYREHSCSLRTTDLELTLFDISSDLTKADVYADELTYSHGFLHCNTVLSLEVGLTS